MPSVKGTASVADSRARQKALRTTKFPRNFSKAVSVEKVNKPVLTQWIEQKITSILGFEDEIVSSTAINLFLPSDDVSPDPRKAQLDLAGFLGDEAVSFSAELWKLLLEAQESNCGIPRTLLERKKKEMLEGANRSRENERQHEPFARAHDIPKTNRGRSRNGDARNYSSSESHLRGNGSSSKQESNSEKNDTDDFGRVRPPHRSMNASKRTSHSRYSRDHPDNSETLRRNHRRSRSREMHERDSGHRRRPDDRNRIITGDRRQSLLYYSNDRDNRTGYYHQKYRHQNDFFDRDNYYRENRRERYHDYDQEMYHLKRRLSQLKNHYSGRGADIGNEDTHSIDNEINYVEGKIYQLKRRMQESFSSRDRYYDSRRRRSRSSSRDYRRSDQRKRSDSTNSESSDTRRSNGDDYSTDRKSSYSPSPARNRKTKDRNSQKVKSRRRARSFSSSERSEHSS